MISAVRFGVLAAPAVVLSFVGPAHADPRLELSGFFGVDYFGHKVGLGDALAPEQIPQTSPVFGGRATYVLLPDLFRRIDLAGEGELTFTPAWTGYGFDGPRMSYFAPVFGYRADILARMHLPLVTPHLMVGGGFETVTSGSPFMATDTDPVFSFGVGASIAIATGWVMRFDGREGIQPARDGGTAHTFQLLVGIGEMTRHKQAHKHFGEDLKIMRGPLVSEPAVEADTDGDGIPDKLDACPHERETMNGIDDDDGCPETDPDGDGIIGSADKCPTQAEDLDHFQDEDGCPDLDNDGDGIPDTKDACPNDAETKNGIE